MAARHQQQHRDGAVPGLHRGQAAAAAAGKGFLAQSFFTGFGITLANVSLFVFQSFITGATDAGIPYWVVGSFMLGSVCSIATVLVSVITTKEIPPSPEELAALRAKKGGVGAAVAEIWEAIVEMPAELRKLALVYLFQWYAMVCYWQYVSLSIAQSAGSSAGRPGLRGRGLVDRPGQRLVQHRHVPRGLPAGRARQEAGRQAGAHLLPALRLGRTADLPAGLSNKYLMFLPITGLGIAWASIMGVPYIMAVRMIPSSRYGVYMGIINMMIVIPMLIQTVTFGAIYSSVLGDNPSNAIRFAAILLAVAAAAMLWIKEPPIVRDVDDVLEMPMGGGH